MTFCSGNARTYLKVALAAGVATTLGAIFYAGRPVPPTITPPIPNNVLVQPVTPQKSAVSGSRLTYLRELLTQQPNNTEWKGYVMGIMNDFHRGIRPKSIEAILCEPDDIEVVSHVQNALTSAGRTDADGDVTTLITQYLQSKEAALHVMPATQKTTGMQVPQVINVTRNVLKVNCCNTDADMHSFLRNVYNTAASFCDGVVATANVTPTDIADDKVSVPFFCGVSGMEHAYAELKFAFNPAAQTSDVYRTHLLGLYCDHRSLAENTATTQIMKDKLATILTNQADFQIDRNSTLGKFRVTRTIEGTPHPETFDDPNRNNTPQPLIAPQQDF